MVNKSHHSVDIYCVFLLSFLQFCSTDEDARQAMLLDGGCIKDVQIKLLLSSRNEMQKIIETVQQQILLKSLENIHRDDKGHKRSDRSRSRSRSRERRSKSSRSGGGGGGGGGGGRHGGGGSDMRRGPPGQDFQEQRGFGPNRGGPRFYKPQQAVPPVVGQRNHGGGAGQRSFDEFGNGGEPRLNHQQHQQPPRYGGHNIQEGGGRGGRPSRFSSINVNGKPYSRFYQAPQQQQQSRRDNDEGRPVDFDDSKRIPPRYNDRYRYDVRNAQVSHSDGLCVEVNNMSNPFSYGDIRKLFEGIHIDGSAIKIQKHRQGVAFVRFDNNHNKNLAMKVNGTAYKGNQVVVKHLDDEAYERDNTDDQPYPSTAVAPNIADHVELMDDDDDEEGATDQPAVSSDKNKSNWAIPGDEGSDDDDDDDNNVLVVCEKSSSKDALSTENSADSAASVLANSSAAPMNSPSG